MNYKGRWLSVLVPVFLLALLFWPYIVGTAQQPKRRSYRLAMLNAKFQFVRLQAGRVTLVPREILFVHVKPKDRVLHLAQSSTFELTNKRHWTDRYRIAKIDDDGVVLNYRDSGRTFFPYESLKLNWK